MSVDRWSLRRSSNGREAGWVIFPPDDIACSVTDPLWNRYYSRMHHDHTTGIDRLGYRFHNSPFGYRMAIYALRYVYRANR